MRVLDNIAIEMEREAEGTKKILGRVPAEKFDWKPHEKSMSLKKLATHIAEIYAMPGAVITQDYLDLKEVPENEIDSTDDIVNLLDKNVKMALEAINDADEAELEKDFELRYGDQVIMGMAKGGFLRKMGMNHVYHHRGQLSVYLRLLDVPVPGLYGPSADEK